MTDYLSIALKGYIANYAGLPKSCWQGIILTIINTTSVGICFFLSLYFVNTLNIDIATAGLLISCYGLGTAIGGIIGGKLSDLINPRIVTIISLFIQAFGYFLLAKIKSVDMLMINLFILGVAAYGFKTSNNLWVLDQCKLLPSMRLKTVNILYGASNLGLGLSGIIIGAFAVYGFQNIFYVSSTLLFLSAIYLIVQEAEHHVSTEYSTTTHLNSTNEPSILVPNKKIIFLILICVFLVGLIIAQLSSTYPIYVQNAFPKLGIKAVSILFILDTFLIVLFQASLTKLLNNYNKMLIVGAGGFLMGLGMLVLSFATMFAMGIISCIIWTLGEMLFMPTAQLICYEKGAEKKKGQSMGIFQATFATSIIVGPTIGSFVYHRFGGDILWYVSMLIGIFCLVSCHYYKEYE